MSIILILRNIIKQFIMQNLIIKLFTIFSTSISYSVLFIRALLDLAKYVLSSNDNISIKACAIITYMDLHPNLSRYCSSNPLHH